MKNPGILYIMDKSEKTYVFAHFALDFFRLILLQFIFCIRKKPIRCHVMNRHPRHHRKRKD